MQKHQWRQHGIVHFKSRPSYHHNSSSSNNNNSANNNNNNTSQPSLSIIGAEGVLYKALNDGVKEVGTTSLGLNQPQEEYIELNGSLIEAAGQKVVGQPEFTDQQPIDANHQQPQELAQPQQQQIKGLHHQPPSVSALFDEAEEVPEACEETVVQTSESPEPEDRQNKPIKLKMKLAQAYMKEVEQIREREERSERQADGRGDWPVLGVEDGGGGEGAGSGSYRLDHSLSDIRLSGSDSNSTSNPDSRPLSRAPEPIPALLDGHRIAQDLEEPADQSATPNLTAASEKECLEFVCKSCGTKCLVSDPYSFRCTACSMKYTSLPTHMIADPLQCIGCTEIFLHKPALKQHQSSDDKERPFRCCKCGFEFRQKAHLQKHQWRIHRKKFEADQSVREAEALLNVVDQLSTLTRRDESSAAAVVVINEAPPLTLPQPEQQQVVASAREELPTETTRLEKVVRSELDQSCQSPLDLSPVKMYGTAGSITKWVEQVETARTPIVPDISIIHKKVGAPVLTPPNHQQPLARFKELLGRPNELSPSSSPSQSNHHHQRQQKDQVQLHIVNSLSGRHEEPLTIRLTDSPRTPVDQQKPFAVKSKPPPLPPPAATPNAAAAWKNLEQADNPLINQINASTVSEKVAAAVAAERVGLPPTSPAVCIIRASKRARTDLTGSGPESATVLIHPNQQAASDLSATPRPQQAAVAVAAATKPRPDSLEARLMTPLLLDTSPLRLDATSPLRLDTTPAYSTLSPPLNLSSRSPQVSPYDYRIKSSSLISGHFHRLKSEDDRSGI